MELRSGSGEADLRCRSSRSSESGLVSGLRALAQRSNSGQYWDGESTVAFLSFFFQAEDGIRDLTVTGVQTCALPISSRHRLIRGDLPCTPRTTSGIVPVPPARAWGWPLQFLAQCSWREDNEPTSLLDWERGV